MSQQVESLLTTDLTGQIAPLGKEPELDVTYWEDEGCMCFQVEVEGHRVARRDGADPLSF